MMIKDQAKWVAWQAETLAKEPPDFQRNLKILEALYEHAHLLGAFSSLDPLAELDVKIKMAKALNAPTSPPADCTRPR